MENAGDIGALVITNCQGSSQGTKRIVAVTGDLADEVDVITATFDSCSTSHLFLEFLQLVCFCLRSSGLHQLSKK